MRIRTPAVALLLLASAGCKPKLPPGLGDKVTDTHLEVIEGSGSPWGIGTEMKLSDLEGKPIVLDFWASWCGACTIQHEYVSRLKERYGDRIQVVGVVWHDSDEAARQWVQKRGAVYPTTQDRKDRLGKELWINGLPRFVLLTPDRRLAWDYMGAARGPNEPNADSVDARIERMLGSGM